MSVLTESVVVESRPGDNTGLGVINVSIDAAGVVASSPTRFKQDANVLHDKEVLRHTVLAAAVDNFLWVCTEGQWLLESAYYLPTVIGTGGAATVDIKVCGVAVAPASGVTQLTAGLDLVGTANTLVRGVLIAAPTVIGPGAAIALDYTGTLTSVVGCLVVNLKRTA